MNVYPIPRWSIFGNSSIDIKPHWVVTHFKGLYTRKSKGEQLKLDTTQKGALK